MSELRYRTVTQSTNSNNNMSSRSLSRNRNVPSSANDNSDHFFDEGLSYAAIQTSSPIHGGKVLKLHVPLLYSLLPLFLQRSLTKSCSSSSSSDSYLRSLLTFLNLLPHWKERHLAAAGKYLYKFKDQHSTKLKGRPIPLVTITPRLESPPKSNERHYSIRHDDLNLVNEYTLAPLPPYCFGSFTLTSSSYNHNTKTVQYAVRTQQEAQVWIETFRQQRQERIKRDLGHDNGMPYPDEWDRLDRMAERCVKGRDRVENRMRTLQHREMEMVAMSLGAGGGASAGGVGVGVGVPDVVMDGGMDGTGYFT